MTTPTTSLGSAKLDAIARGIKAHGSGVANVKRLATLFNVSEESIADAIAVANAPHTESGPEPTVKVSPVLLDRATRFQHEVIAAQAKPLSSASTADLENMLAAAVSR
jgi:hypothetical protein